MKFFKIYAALLLAIFLMDLMILNKNMLKKSTKKPNTFINSIEDLIKN